jgi:pullulanase/glycogen debranching enzyme
MKTSFRKVLVNKFFWFALVLLSLAALALPGRAANEGVPGTRNGWNVGAWAMSANLGGSYLYTSGAQTTCGSEQFKFYNGGWYSNGGAVTYGTKLTGLSTSTSGNMTYACTSSKHYAFKWSGSGGATGVVFQLSAAPVGVSSVTQNPAAPSSAQSVVVTANASGAKPSEQAFWLRYTTNAWAGSTVVKMTGSGTVYTATIPAQASGTAVSYYVFTSGNVASIAAADADLMTLTYNNNGGANYSYAIAGGAPTPIPDAQAIWLDATTLGWAGGTSTSYKLLYAPNGGLIASTAAATACTFPTPTAQCYVSLTANGTVSGYWKNPNANNLPRLTNTLTSAQVKTLLKGQVAVASYSGNTLVDISGVQLQSVLDALYAANAKTQTLGVTYSGSIPTLRVWAPTAKAVAIRRYADATTSAYTTHNLTEDANSGVWNVTGDATWNRQFYLLEVQVYVPSLNAVVNNLVSDPYAISLSADTSSTGDPRSQFVNLSDADLKPAGWDTLAKPALTNPEDIVVYEVHIRDFSINDGSVPAADRGTYNAFTYDGQGGRALSNGMNHVKQLQQAGLTHIHLLPTFDIASANEAIVTRTVWPSPTGFGRDSDQQQASVAATRGADSFNWGYDPMHYGAPEGSYSTNANGVTRVLEFRKMVAALNTHGLRVVMDVVYNHVAAYGQDEKSVLDKVVPGYYLRYDTNGALQMSSWCADTAMEYDMAEKLMIDTLKRFAVDYKVDGFRFDLMNLHTRQNMLNVKSTLNALTVGSNGVDGSKIYLYGEGWDFGSAAGKGLTTCPNCYAKQWNMTGTGIGLFNDKIRDAAHGGYNTDALQIRKQGFINGLSYDWNGYTYNQRYQSDLWNATADLRVGLGGSGSWFAGDPSETVNYVEKHDNETLFDQNAFKLPVGASLADRVRAQNMGATLMALAQGIPFFQMGTDTLRSKSLDRNSYDSGDWFNRVDWTYSTNYFGTGLPPAWDNSSRWSIMSPLLTNTSLDPTSAQIQFAAGQMREALRLRKSSPLFRLTTNADIASRVSFYNTNNTHDALIVMVLSDETATDIDPNNESIVVIFNAHKVAQTYTIAAMAGRGYTLHPVQADATDADAVVKTATFNNSTGAFTVPARTTAVFVTNQSAPVVSTIDWVGLMWPRGGSVNSIKQGTATANFDVYIQVYEAGVTPGAGAGANITCYLSWGPVGGAWTDVAMTYHTEQGNNDEYKGSLTPAMLNALGAGNYAYNTYCKHNSESGKKWKVDATDINGNMNDDDVGNGQLSIVP